MYIQKRYTLFIYLSRHFCYTCCIYNFEGYFMKVEQLRKMFKNKSRLITMRINPDLLNLLDETVKKDKEFDSRNELIETLILRYLEQRGTLK